MVFRQSAACTGRNDGQHAGNSDHPVRCGVQVPTRHWVSSRPRFPGSVKRMAAGKTAAGENTSNPPYARAGANRMHCSLSTGRTGVRFPGLAPIRVQLPIRRG